MVGYFYNLPLKPQVRTLHLIMCKQNIYRWRCGCIAEINNEMCPEAKKTGKWCKDKAEYWPEDWPDECDKCREEEKASAAKKSKGMIFRKLRSPIHS
jgi:hypothetical protein